jgi:hypothetical protein
MVGVGGKYVGVCVGGMIVKVAWWTMIVGVVVGTDSGVWTGVQETSNIKVRNII